jgi:hypothetical protein
MQNGILLERVTLRALARLTTELMRRTSIASVLLILVLATSASACVAGWGQQADSCAHTIRPVSPLAKPGIATRTQCSHALESLPGRCGMRSFIQFQFVAFHAFQISAPLKRAAGNISRPPDAVIIASSIGSPETDRGPPRS